MISSIARKNQSVSGPPTMNAVSDRDRGRKAPDGSTCTQIGVICRERTLAHHHRAIEAINGSAVSIGPCREVSGERALAKRNLTIDGRSRNRPMTVFNRQAN
jgi:hypothetical protein